jgi:subtilisin family serine protease
MYFIDSQDIIYFPTQKKSMKSGKKILILILTLSSFFACNKDNEVVPVKGSDPETGSPVNSVEPECPTGNAGQPVAGQYIVVLKKDDQMSVAESGSATVSREYLVKRSLRLLARHGIENFVCNVYVSGIKGFAARLNEEKLNEIKSDPEVASIEQDRFIALSPAEMTASADSAGQTVPWGIKRLGAGTGSPTSKTAWILDTGVDTDHPDLNVDYSRSKSFVCSEPSFEDLNGHGTHVAGTIAAKNNAIGVVGIVPGNQVVALKVMASDGKGTISSLLEGLDYIYKNGRAGDVVNMSLSGGSSQTLDNLVTKIANEKNIYFAVAAGNENADAASLSPQRVNNAYIYTVSAMDNQDNYASFSNYGTCVDLCAPGVKIASTFLNGKYAYLSGTSMATPHVAGLLLLKGSGIRTDGTVKNDPDGRPDPIAHL